MDCVGYEAHGLGKQSDVEAPLLNPLMEVSRVPSGIGVPGLYLPEDSEGADEMRKQGIQRQFHARILPESPSGAVVGAVIPAHTTLYRAPARAASH